MRDAKRRGLRARHAQARDRRLGAGREMRVDHLADIHLVDVIAAQYEDERRTMLADDIDVLKYRIGGAGIPFAAHALLGREQLDEIPEATV